MQEEKHNKCWFCSDEIADYSIHLFECPSLANIKVKENPTFYKIGEETNICKFCQRIFNNMDWIQHRKTQKCRKI